MVKFINFIICLFMSFVFTVSTVNQVIAVDKKININTADVKELCLLKRIGPGYADRIIKYREKNGDFKNPEDIMKVRGVGKKTYEVNKEVIIVAEEIAEPPKTE